MAKKTLSAVVIDALEDIKARDIQLVNVSKITSVFDYIAIASADSTRQTKALANNVVTKVKEAGFYVIGIEGEVSGEWVLVDCGDIVVHIMQPAIREYYKLEELWREGKLEFPRPTTAKPMKIVEEAKATPRKKAAAVAATKTTAKATAKATTTTNTKTSTKTTATTAAKAVPKAKPKTKVVDGVKTSTTAKRTGVAVTTAKKPVVAKKPVAVKTVAAKPVAKKPVAKKPAAKTPAAKKPVAKKPVAKKPAAKKPAAKKPITSKRGS